MAHFAKVRDGFVVDIIVAEPEFFDTFVDSSSGTWIQTSYNTRGGVHLNGDTPLRKNYASIGMLYDEKRDAFYHPQPFPSWTLDEFSFLWEPPVPMPVDEHAYTWDEDNQVWSQRT